MNIKESIRFVDSFKRRVPLARDEIVEFNKIIKLLRILTWFQKGFEQGVQINKKEVIK